MPNSEMDYNGNRQQRRNEIHISHRQALPGQSAYMSFKNHGSAGYHSNAGLRHRTPSDHQFHHHPHKLKILGSMSHCTASTASLSDSEFGGDSTDSCRIHHASAGESKSYLSLEPISYASTSLAEDDYWRLNNSSVNEDKSLGTASTTMSAPTYYRPVDSFGEIISSNVSTTSSRLPPRAVSARTICSHLDEMSAVTFSYSLSEDGHESNPHTIQHKQTTRSPQRKIEKTICWTDDDSELKRMESITHSFQRSSSMASRNHKISAPPLSGIGVEICRSTSCQHDHIPTPREAANVSCSLSSIMGELLGVAQPKGKGLFSGFKMMICNSDTYNTDIRTSSKYDGDDWSFDADSQADEPGRYTYDDDQSEPCIGNCDVGHGNHVERLRKRPPRSAECRRGTSRIDKSGADPSRRQLTTQFSCDNDEYNDTSKRLSQRVERRRKFQDSPHVRRITNMRR